MRAAPTSPLSSASPQAGQPAALPVERRAWLRAYVYAFIEGFAPQLTRTMVEQTMAGGGTDAGL